ncbi:unnamed protein product [Sphagnum troendelagicum]|uniref:Clp R domain-containing protein n=1 Tax=Sphagnum troendelagicum TaxID=128251 RepID=A0ABP0TKN7_9BRYO
MRAGANWVQHTLTAPAQSVLKHAIAEARRRGHAQVQPLHVAAMLLSHSGTGLHEASMLAGPTPLRALEVCFNVALDHLAQSGPATPSQPTLSNALVAALKRAHAHQRRGCCSEQQQPPLLAIKVELEQLIVSVLDDPSVSRVIKEAGSSSAHIKGNLEDNISSCLTPSTSISCLPSTDSILSSRPTNIVSLLLTGNVLQLVQPGVEFGGRENDVCRLIEILLRPSKRNALLVVDSDSSARADAVVKDLAILIKMGQVPEQLCRLKVLDPQLSSLSFASCSQLDMEQKLGKLSNIVDECMPAGAVLHLGDLQWLSDPVHFKKGAVRFCPAQHAAAELGRLLLRHAGSRLWFVGVATQQVFVKCQARHPELEVQWGLQPLQVASSTSLYFSALQQLEKTAKGPDSSSARLYAVEGKVPNLAAVRPCHGDDKIGDKLQCCAECLAKFEQERHQLHELERLSLHLAPTDLRSQITNPKIDGLQVKEHSVIQKLKELHWKWQETCQNVHAHLHAPVSSILKTEPSPISKRLGNGTTDLALGRPSALTVSGSPISHSLKNTVMNCSPLQRRPQWQIHQEQMQGRTGGTSPLRGLQWQMVNSRSTELKLPPPATTALFINQGPLQAFQESIADSLKGLYKALLSRVGWQGEAVAAITSTVMNCRAGMGKMRGVMSKTDSWLLFLGPDPLAKQLIAKALTEMVSGSEQNLICLGFGDQAVSRLETDDNGIRYRGRSSLDRLAEAVRMKPFSVLLLEDIDKADSVVRASLLRAMERGKLVDSSGREVSFGNVIVLMTSNIGSESLVPEHSLGGLKFSVERLVALGGVDGFLKRKSDGPILRQTDPRVQVKRPKLSFSERPARALDLNLLAEENEEDSLTYGGNGQAQRDCRSSQEDKSQSAEDVIKNRILGCAQDVLSDKFFGLLDHTVVFKAYDFYGLANHVLARLTKAFEGITMQGASLEVDVTVLEHILAAIWRGSTVFDTWVADVVGKSVTAVLADVTIAENTVVKLVGDMRRGCIRDSCIAENNTSTGPQLPLFIEISQST